MALKWGDRVAETSTTTGTGAFTLAAALTGYRRFSAVCSTNDTIYYVIFAVDANGNPSGDWETGLGTYSSADTLTRTTPVASTNGGAAVNFAAGTKWVLLTPIASIQPTAFALTLLDDPDAATGRSTLGLAIGSNVQAYDADLDALAALSGTNTIYYRSAANTWTAVTIGADLSFSGGTLKVSDYSIGFFFTSVPTVSEVLLLHVAGAAFTIPANFSGGLQSSVGTNPTATFALDVQKNGSTIGTLSVSTGGVVTATTTSGTSKSIAAGDVIKIVAPSPVDATAANMAFTIIGAR